MLSRPTHALDPAIQVDLHSFRPEPVEHPVGHVLVFPGQDLSGTLNHGDPAAETPEGLSHFDGHGPAADAEHGLGQPVQGEYLPVGDVGRGFQAVHGRNRGGRTRGDEPFGRREPPAVDLHRVFVQKSRRTEDHLDPQGAKAFFGIVLPDAFDDRFDPGGDPAKVHGRNLRLRQAESRSRIHEVVDLGALDQRLGRNAAVVQAVAAETVLSFDKQGLGPELRCSGSEGQAGRSAADHAAIEIVLSHGLAPYSVAGSGRCFKFRRTRKAALSFRQYTAK